MSAKDLPVDVDVLRDEIRKTYTDVSTDTDQDFIFPTGRAGRRTSATRARARRVPDATVESFAGVANHWMLGRIEPGATVLDLGCGAGTDLLIAAQMTGPSGRVIGIDMTSSMLERAQASAAEMGIDNIELHESLIESLPLEDGSRRHRDLQRRDRPGPRQGRRVRRDRSRPEAGRAAADRRRRDPHGGLRGRARRHRPLDRVNRRRAASKESTRACWSQRAYTEIVQGDLVDTYSRSMFEDTRRKAAKFGAMGSTIRATKARRPA